MAREQFANSYSTTLNGAIDASQTTLTLTSATGAPTAPFRIKIGSELMLVGARTTTACSAITRGAEGSTAATHSDLDVIMHVLTAAGLLNMPGAMTTTGDVEYLDSSGNRARLAAVAIGKLLGSAGTSTAPAYTAATALLLDYALASDISNQAITFDTYFDLFANQNFTVVSATSLIEVAIRGFGFYNDNANDQFLTRINVDSGGTPILKYLSGVQNTNTTTDTRPNPLAGGSIYLSGLAAGVHTIKMQITSVGANNHFYCRASTNGPPTTGAEFLNVQVVEHL